MIGGFSVHRAVNEIPIVTMGVTILLLAYGWLRDARAARVCAYAGFALAGGFSILLAASGEHAASALASQAAAAAFTTHRYLAGTALALTMLCLMLAVALDVLERNARFYRVAAPSLLVLSLITFLTMLATAGAGKAMFDP
jgi:hypothetical protein